MGYSKLAMAKKKKSTVNLQIIKEIPTENQREK